MTMSLPFKHCASAPMIISANHRRSITSWPRSIAPFRCDSWASRWRGSSLTWNGMPSNWSARCRSVRRSSAERSASERGSRRRCNSQISSSRIGSRSWRNGRSRSLFWARWQRCSKPVKASRKRVPSRHNFSKNCSQPMREVSACIRIRCVL